MRFGGENGDGVEGEFWDAWGVAGDFTPSARFEAAADGRRWGEASGVRGSGSTVCAIAELACVEATMMLFWADTLIKMVAVQMNLNIFTV